MPASSTTACRRCGAAFDPDAGEGADGYCLRCHYAVTWGAFGGGAASNMPREGVVAGHAQGTVAGPSSTAAVRYLTPHRRTYRAGLRSG